MSTDTIPRVIETPTGEELPQPDHVTVEKLDGTCRHTCTTKAAHVLLSSAGWRIVGEDDDAAPRRGRTRPPALEE